MASGIDHLVIAVNDPDAAAAELTETVGLAFTAGGRHVGQCEQGQHLPGSRVHPADAAVALGHPDKVIGSPHQLPNGVQVLRQGRNSDGGSSHRKRGQDRGLRAGNERADERKQPQGERT